MKGKNRCKILKDIRKRIAEENNIEYITTECKYKGDCLGTCPKCESEVRYLESELEKRRRLGYKVTVAGLAAGITLASAGCTFEETLKGDMEMEITSNESSGITSLPDESESSVDVMGQVEAIPEIPNPYPDIMGEYEVFYTDLKDIVDLSVDEIYKELRNWNRKYIDFAWKDYIYGYSERETCFTTEEGKGLCLGYDEAGNIFAINGQQVTSIDDEK